MTSKYLIPLLTSVITACSIYPALGQETTASEITFICENNNDTPITIARDKKGKTQTVFYWKKEVLANKTRFTNQELCSDVSAKLNEYTKDSDLASIGFDSGDVSELPAICITPRWRGCHEILFIIYPVKEKSPLDAANDVLFQILDSKITNNQKNNPYGRDFRNPAYQLDFYEIFDNKK